MFRKTAQLLYKCVGSTSVNDLAPEWQKPVHEVLEQLERSNPKFENAEIKGGPHKSHDDPDDSEDVVSIRIRDAEMKRIGTAHVHLDGTSKVKYK